MFLNTSTFGDCMAAYCILALLGYCTAFVVLQMVIARHFRVPRIAQADPPARLLLLALTGPLVVLALRSLANQPVRFLATTAGSVIIVAGLCVSMWAQWTLGKNWVGGVGLHKRHRLVTSGPYRYVRHPLYSGIFVSAVGFGVCSLNALFFAAMLSLAASFLLRLPAEERMLRGKFKQRYEHYATTTGTLVPRFWK